MLQQTETFYPSIRIYARPPDAEREPDDPDVDTQLESLREIAERTPHERIVEYVDETAAVTEPATERPTLQRLLREVEPGDLALCWDLYSLSRCTGVELSAIMREIIVDREAHLIVTHQFGNKRLQLDRVSGVLLVAGMELVNEINTKGRAEYARQLRAYYKRHGLYMGGTRPPGRPTPGEDHAGREDVQDGPLG